ncbi:hypothetical protein J4406_00175 [Candidatus Woesearchaeota archaeon]|nr:hypothetical protein [Candidatus Woesearchaeota archaeon]
MQIFVSKINEKFSIKRVSENLKKPYPLVHRSIKALIDNKFISKDRQNFLSLNHKQNHSELAYIESLRKKEFLESNKTITLFINDVMEKINLDLFIFLIFGSHIKKQKSRDIDILVIIEDKKKVNIIEKILNNIASNFTVKFDVNIISVESAYEMLAKRDKINIVNETLDNHLLIFGAENYYRLLKNAR